MENIEQEKLCHIPYNWARFSILTNARAFCFLLVREKALIGRVRGRVKALIYLDFGRFGGLNEEAPEEAVQ